MKTRHYMLLGAAALMLAGSFFLPNAVAAVTDMRRFDNLLMVDSQSISFEVAQELSLLERIALAANSNTEFLPLKTGNVMDTEAAADRVFLELERFAGSSPWKADFTEYLIEESTASLVIDTMIPSLNMIVWEFTLSDPSENEVMVIIDDETGVILRMVYKWKLFNFTPSDKEASGLPALPGLTEPSSRSDLTDEERHEVAQALADMMRAYYGQPVELGDYLYSENLSWYRADISDATGLVIPMYGVIRPTGFTINERVRRDQA